MSQGEFSADYFLAELKDIRRQDWKLADLVALAEELHKRPEGVAPSRAAGRRLDENRIFEALAHPNFHFVVCVEKKSHKIVGMGTVVFWPDPIDGGSGEIDNMAVHPAHQRRGIGGRVFDRLMSIASSYGSRQIRLHHDEFPIESVTLTSAPWREAANAMYMRKGGEKRETNVYRFKVNNG